MQADRSKARQPGRARGPAAGRQGNAGDDPTEEELRFQNIDLERHFLGAVLIHSDLAHDLSITVRPEDLHDERHQTIWRGMLSYDGDPNVASLEQYLAERGWLEEAGGLAYLTTLIGHDEELRSRPRQYADQIREIAEKRRVLASTSRIADVNSRQGSKAALAVMRREIEALDLSQPVAELRGSSWADASQILHTIEWAWPGWLPSGFLTLLVGEQAVGKSYLALAIASRYLTGEAWPDGQPFTGQTGAILWAEAEAGQAMNLERARTLKLPLDRILSPLEDPIADFRLDNEVHKLAFASFLGRSGVQMAVLDSLSGSHGRREADAEMLLLVKWLAEVARDTGKPVLLTHHLRKRTILDVGGVVTLDRARGSNTITQTARSVLSASIPDPKKRPDARRLEVTKCNVALKTGQLGFGIGENGVSFCSEAPEEPQPESQIDRAKELLLALLDSGPMDASAIQNEGEREGISQRTTQRASKELRVVRRKLNGHMVWSLPYKGPMDGQVQ